MKKKMFQTNPIVDSVLLICILTYFYITKKRTGKFVDPLQGGPLPFINGLITPINGLING